MPNKNEKKTRSAPGADMNPLEKLNAETLG